MKLRMDYNGAARLTPCILNFVSRVAQLGHGVYLRLAFTRNPTSTLFLFLSLSWPGGPDVVGEHGVGAPSRGLSAGLLTFILYRPLTLLAFPLHAGSIFSLIPLQNQRL